MINPKETFEEERQRRTIVLPFHILYQDTYLCCYRNLYGFVHHQLISFIFFPIVSALPTESFLREKILSLHYGSSRNQGGGRWRGQI